MKALDKFTKDRFDSLNANLTRYHLFQDASSLHHIRVEINMIKAAKKFYS